MSSHSVNLYSNAVAVELKWLKRYAQPIIVSIICALPTIQSIVTRNVPRKLKIWNMYLDYLKSLYSM